MVCLIVFTLIKNLMHSHFPVTNLSPGVDWKKNGIAVTVPSNRSPEKLLPQGHTPVKGILANYFYMNLYSSAATNSFSD